MNNVKSWAQVQEEARLAALRSQAQAQQYNQGRIPVGAGGNMYAGGDPNFNERTGQPYNRVAYDYTAPNGAPGHFNPNAFTMRDWIPQARPGDGYLAMLLKKYGGAAQGAGGEIGDWFRSRMPQANSEWNNHWKARNEAMIKRNGG